MPSTYSSKLTLSPQITVLYELYALKFLVPDFCLWEQDPALLHVEYHDVGGDAALVLLRLQGHHHLVLLIREKQEGSTVCSILQSPGSIGTRI
jgi:hypothetical protein